METSSTIDGTAAGLLFAGLCLYYFAAYQWEKGKGRAAVNAVYRACQKATFVCRRFV